jgi:hypothetical protein
LAWLNKGAHGISFVGFDLIEVANRWFAFERDLAASRGKANLLQEGIRDHPASHAGVVPV